MTTELGINTADFLLLNNDIRISSTSSYNAQEASDGVFEDILLEQNTNNEINKKEPITLNLGAPAGFILDTSLLNESGELIVDSTKNHPDSNLKKYIL